MAHKYKDTQVYWYKSILAHKYNGALYYTIIKNIYNCVIALFTLTGFEPVNIDIKNQCLSTWLQCNLLNLLSYKYAIL